MTSKKTGNKVIAIAGNPNCGKTTLFNSLTGANQRIGNWPGVTVEKKEGTMRTSTGDITVVDLPGIYSLSASSEDEKAARDYLLSFEADLVINIIDGTNFERNLFLTTYLLEMNIPVIAVINMMDIVIRKKMTIDIEHLSKHLGVPVIAISATDKQDVKRFAGYIAENIGRINPSTSRISYPNEMETLISKTESFFKNEKASRFKAVSLLEGSFFSDSVDTDSLKSISAERLKIEKNLGEKIDMISADSRYAYIHGISADVIKTTGKSYSFTSKLDSFALNRFLGIPLFLFVMYLLFWFSISVGGAFIDFFDISFGAVFVDGFAEFLKKAGSSEILITFLANGIGGGIQTVATFVPIIFAMFFGLSILEDSGYMARAAFVVDRFMRFLGLPGKAFVSMIVGFGCTVPAIMSTRTLESKKDRLLTIFMSPFMSCGARLPVYVLFGAAFFPASSGLMVFSLYLTGIVLSVLTGFLLTKTIMKGEASHFIMELPPYHLPRFRHIMIHTWNRLKLFILRAGSAIITIVIILSFLNSIGTDGSFGNEDTDKSVLSSISKKITPVLSPMGIEEENWPATVGIFTGIFAKEAVVGTLNSLYAANSSATEEQSSGETPQKTEEATEDESETTQDTQSTEEEFSLSASLKESLITIPENLSGVFGSLADPLGLESLEAANDEKTAAEELETDEGIFAAMRRNFSQGSMQAYAYLLFILIYFPCVAAFGAVKREAGIKFAFGVAAYLTVLAWIVATLFYQITAGHSMFWIIFAAAMSSLLVLTFKFAIPKIKEVEEEIR